MKINLKSPGFIILCILVGLPLTFSLVSCAPIKESKGIKTDSKQTPAPKTVEISEKCEQYLKDTANDLRNKQFLIESRSKNFAWNCRSVSEFVAASIKYNTYKMDNPNSLKTRALSYCQGYVEIKNKPICTEILATPGLIKENYLGIKFDDYYTPVPVTINSVKTMIPAGQTVKILARSADSTMFKVELGGSDVKDNDVSGKIALVKSNYVQTDLSLPQ
jgi:hypothetical protein